MKITPFTDKAPIQTTKIKLFLISFLIYLSTTLHAQIDYGVQSTLGLVKVCSSNNTPKQDHPASRPQAWTGCSNYRNPDFGLHGYVDIPIWHIKNGVSLVASTMAGYDFSYFKKLDFRSSTSPTIDWQVPDYARPGSDNSAIRSTNVGMHSLSLNIELVGILYKGFGIGYGYQLRYAFYKSYFKDIRFAMDFLSEKGYDNRWYKSPYITLSYKHKRWEICYYLLQFHAPVSYVWESDIFKDTQATPTNYWDRPGGPQRYNWERSHEIGIKMSLK